MNEISKKRKALGMTQQELGDKVGVGWKTISNLETSKNCKFSLLQKVCDVLGLAIQIVDISPIPTEEKGKKKKRTLSVSSFSLPIYHY